MVVLGYSLQETVLADVEVLTIFAVVSFVSDGAYPANVAFVVCKEEVLRWLGDVVDLNLWEELVLGLFLFGCLGSCYLELSLQDLVHRYFIRFLHVDLYQGLVAQSAFVGPSPFLTFFFGGRLDRLRVARVRLIADQALGL